MITKEMILSGISAGIVELIDSPHDLEPVCKIGEHWIYYAGSEGAGLTSTEYTANIPLDDVASEIVDALEGIRDGLDGADEYGYYEAVLREAGITESGGRRMRKCETELYCGRQGSHETYGTYPLQKDDEPRKKQQRKRSQERQSRW